MSGEFTRKKFDFYPYRLLESTNQINYVLDPWSQRTCLLSRPPQPGVLGKYGVSVSTDRTQTDIESDLFNINRKINDDPRTKYLPKDDLNAEPRVNFPELYFDRIETRLTDPAINLRGTGWFEDHVYEPLCLNPQDPERIFHPGMIYIPSRIIHKDNHRPLIKYPQEEKPLKGFATQYDIYNRNVKSCVDIENDICGVFNKPLNKNVFHPYKPSVYYQTPNKY